VRRRALREAWARFVRDERGGLFVPNTNLARMIPLDASDLLYWPMTEDAAPFANAGNAGALTLSGTSGTPTVRRTGLFGRGAVDMNGNSGGTTDSLASAATSVGETAGVWSISVWCLFRTFPAQFSSLFGKQYRGDGTWTSPFTSCKLGMTNAANGTWDVNVTIAGAGQDLAISGKSDRCTQSSR